ncbi:hypothetical protein [Helicobacter sp. MIT 01-3238]|nr:hypothetical protein [Helicobacter sp. MIT 01-3238]
MWWHNVAVRHSFGISKQGLYFGIKNALFVDMLTKYFAQKGIAK